jgi:hypothetical protein
MKYMTSHFFSEKDDWHLTKKGRFPVDRKNLGSVLLHEKDFFQDIIHTCKRTSKMDGHHNLHETAYQHY